MAYNPLENPSVQAKLGYSDSSIHGYFDQAGAQAATDNALGNTSNQDVQPIEDNSGGSDYSQKSYMQNAGKIVKMNDIIASLTPDEIAAHPWFSKNKEAIGAAYDYLKYNNTGKDPASWEIPKNPEYLQFLGSIETPTNDILQSYESNYKQPEPTATSTPIAPSAPVTPFNEQPAWMQGYQTLTGGGNGPEDMPPMEKAAGHVVSGALKMLGGFGIGMMGGGLIGAGIGSIVPGPGTAAGGALGADIGAASGTLLGGYAAINDFVDAAGNVQKQLGWTPENTGGIIGQIPTDSKIPFTDQANSVFDAFQGPAKAVEKSIGLASGAYKPSDVFSDFSALSGPQSPLKIISDLQKVITNPQQELVDKPMQNSWVPQYINAMVNGHMDEAQKIVNAAWEAGGLTYATQNADKTNQFLNGLSSADAWIHDTLGMAFPQLHWTPDEGAGRGQAGPGQVWNFSQGATDPINVLDAMGNKTEAKALFTEAMQRIMQNPDDYQKIVAETASRLGDSGNASQLIYQSILDPMNFVSLGETLGVEALAGKMGKDVLAQVAHEHINNPLIDAVPFAIRPVVEAITGQHGSTGLLGILEDYKGRVINGETLKNGYETVTREMPSTEAIKVGDEVKFGDEYKPVEDIKLTDGKVTYKVNGEYVPAEQVSAGPTAVTEQRPVYKAKSEMDLFDRSLAGLDEAGNPNVYKPLEDTGNPVKNWWNKMNSLEPAAQASMLVHNVFDNLGAMFLSVDNPNLSDAERANLIKDNVISKLGIADPKQVQSATEALMHSPLGGPIASILNGIMGDKRWADIFAVYTSDAHQKNVNELKGLANVLDVKPAVLVDNIKNNPSQVFDVLKTKMRPEEMTTKLIGTPDDLANRFSAITGRTRGLGGIKDSPTVPWHFDEFRARIANAILDYGTQNAIKLFGVKEENVVYRLAGLMKTTQSLSLLGLSPSYLINNTINNMVTRAVQGVFGFMTPSQIDAFWKDMEFVPARLHEGVTPTGEGGLESAGAFAKNMRDIRDAVTGDGKIVKLQKMINSANRTFGVFSNLSQMVERSESAQAYTIGAKQLWQNLWQPGKGFQKMTPELETSLRQIDPRLPEFVYATLQGSKNRGQIEVRLWQDVAQVNGQKAINDALTRLHGDNAEVIRSDMTKTGILEEYDRLLQNAKSATDVDAATQAIKQKIKDQIDTESIHKIATVAQEHDNILKNEGFQAIPEMFVEMAQRRGDYWIQHSKDIADQFAYVDTLPKELKNAAWESFWTDDNQKWQSVDALESQVYGALAQNEPRIMGLVEQLRQTWRSAFDAKQQAYAAEAAAGWPNIDAVREAMDALFSDTTKKTGGIQTQIDEQLARRFGNPGDEGYEAIKKLRQNVADVQAEMDAAKAKHLGELKAGRKTGFVDERKMWSDFENNIYAPLIAKLTQSESLFGQDVSKYKPVERPAEAVPPELQALADAMIKDAQSVQDGARAQYDLTLDRNAFREDLKNEYPKVDPENWPIIFKLADLQAREWAAQNGKTPGDWYNQASGDDIVGAVKKYSGDQADAIKRIEDITPDVARGAIADLSLAQEHRAAELKAAVEQGIPQAQAEQANAVPTGQSKIGGVELPEAIRRRDALLSMEPVKVDSTGLGPISDLANLKAKAEDRYKSFANETVINNDDTTVVKFPNSGLKKTLSHKANQMENIRVVQELPELIRNAIRYDESVDNRGRSNMEAYYHYGVFADLDGQKVLVDIVLRKEKNSGVFYYDNMVTNNVSGVLSDDYKPGGSGNVIKNSILRWLSEVNKAEKEKAAVDRLSSLPMDGPIDSNQSKDIPSIQNGQPLQIVGQPLNSTPAPLWMGDVMQEAWNGSYSPMLRQIGEQLKAQLADRPLQYGNTLPDEVKAGLQAYLKGVYANDMPGAKLASMRFGESQRDAALLNYSRRYGFDAPLSVLMPYQFWYTRSMANWAKRMIDKPQIFSMYAKIKDEQRKQQLNGIPTRFQDNMHMAAPWLPEWAGGSIYIDPMKQLFPFEQFLQPLDQLNVDQSARDQQTTQMLRDMQNQGEATPDDVVKAIAEKKGYLWESAAKQVAANADDSIANPTSIVGMMMSPPLWFSTLKNIAQGTPEKISPTPMLRTANAIEQIGNGTPIEALTNLMGTAMGGPERWMRNKMGISELGQFGDSYIDRQLSAMVADGSANVQDATDAMLQRNGPVFDQAVQRAKYEQALKTPLAGVGLALNSAYKGKSSIFDAAGELLPSMFPAGILSKGELEMRGLSKAYNEAWAKVDAAANPNDPNGDKNAVTQFYKDHPEYSIRAIQYKDPQQRMRNMLTGGIWDAYKQLDGPNKTQVENALGDSFKQSFLDKTIADNTAIDLQTLAFWARYVGAHVPRTADTASVLDQPLMDRKSLPLINGRVNDAVQSYWDEKSKLYPNIETIQTKYYAPGTNKQQLMAAFPELKQYWDWNKQYQTAHPEVKAYLSDNKIARDAANANVTPQGGAGSAGSATKAVTPTLAVKDFIGWNPVLQNQWMSYVYGGKPLTRGARQDLYREWNNAGQPGSDFPDYLEQIKNNMLGKAQPAGSTAQPNSNS